MNKLDAVIADRKAFYYLDAPIKRLAGLDVSLPYCPELEKNAIPTSGQIRESIYMLMR